MTDAFGRELKIGDYVVKLSGSDYYDNRYIFRVFGFDEEKSFVYIVEWDNQSYRSKNIFKDFDYACEHVVEYYKAKCGMYGPAKRIINDKIVKTYPPVWQKYDDMEKPKKKKENN